MKTVKLYCVEISNGSDIYDIERYTTKAERLNAILDARRGGFLILGTWTEDETVD